MFIIFFISGEAIAIIGLVCLLLLSAAGEKMQEIFRVVMWIVMILQMGISLAFLIRTFVVEKQDSCGAIISLLSSAMALIISNYIIYDIYLTSMEGGIFGAIGFIFELVMGGCIWLLNACAWLMVNACDRTEPKELIKNCLLQFGGSLVVLNLFFW